MKQFLTRIAGFAAVFAAVSMLLLLADLYVYDYNANTLLNDQQLLENKVVVIGSSKVNHGLIKDSIIKHFPVEIYAAGGQYNLESLNFLFNKQRRGEIGKGNTIFLNLEAGDPLLTSFRKFNWFAENFTIYGFYPWSSFPVNKYPKIMSRIYVDILAVGVNKTESFKTNMLGENGETPPSHIDLEAYRNYCNNTPGMLTNDTLFTATMANICSKLAAMEQQTGSKIYLLIPPGSHMLNNAVVIRQHYPANRIIDLTCIEGLGTDSSWFDGNHVNARGAALFTAKFIETAESLQHR